MSDPLCGGSNALKSFSGHVGQDRSLQQDRTSAGAQPQPGQFRTDDPNATESHDALFNAAFGLEPQFSQPMPQQPLPHTMMSPPQPTASAPMHHMPPMVNNGAHAPSVPDWALQFQSMSIHGAAAPAAPAVAQTSPVSTVSSGMTRVNAGSPPLHTYNTTHAPMGMQSMGMAMGMGMGMQQPMGAAFGSISQQTFNNDTEFHSAMDTWMAENGPAADQAIDAQMEQVARELEQQDRQASLDATAAAVEENIAMNINAAPIATGAVPVGSRVEQEVNATEEATDETKSAEDDTDLAAAARRIVEVMDTTQANDKMRSSGFLGLMRQLADGNVVIKNQDFVDKEGSKVDLSTVRNQEEDEKVEPTLDTGAGPPGGERSVPVSYEPVDLTRPLVR